MNRPNRFTYKINARIDDLLDIDTGEMPGLSKGQLKQLYCQLYILNELRYESRCTFTGEECFLYYVGFHRVGETHLRMNRNYFGGVPRRLYFTRIMTRYIYQNICHKISGTNKNIQISHLAQAERRIQCGRKVKYN